MFNKRTALSAGSLLLGGVLITLSGCASDIGPQTPPINNINGSPCLRFTITVNPYGRIDTEGNGCYAILLNSLGSSIEVTDSDTFTDFIRFNGIDFDWYTRQANLPNAGFTFYQVGSLNPEASISSDGRSLNILLDPYDSNTYLSQYIVNSNFSAQVVTTDNTSDAYLGRVIDFMGDNLNSNSLYTLSIDKFFGLIDPVPSLYPNDYLNDWISHNDLDAAFPYANFDIATFEISVSYPNE
ncbi:MAG: hypothetical protein ACI376_00330 [Candidatus Bruticola sp.]